MELHGMYGYITKNVFGTTGNRKSILHSEVGKII